ncbi:uncharacterized protein LOC144665054 [Oculina patagonica]
MPNKGVKKINGCKEQDRQRDLTSRYWKLNKEVRKSARKDKKEFFNALATEAETAAGQRNMNWLYEITRTMSGKKSKQTRPVKNKEGRTISTEPEQRARWAEHFHDILNRPPPPVTPGFIETNGPLLIVSIYPPPKAEIVRAVKQLKNGKAAGPDGIPPEALKINPNNTAEMLHPLFLKIWEAEKVPTEWKHGYLVKLPKKGDIGLCNNWRGIMLLSIRQARYSAALSLKGLRTPWTNNCDVTRQGLGNINPVLTTLPL